MATVKKEPRILMIVESPVKVKTIKQFLPSNYVVMASVGHITELANSGDHNLGIDVKNDFKGDYVISADKKDVVKKLKEQVKAADKIILATDPDREGEAISWHLLEELKIPEKKYERITYHEITKPAIEKALANPRKVDFDLVAAADCRGKEDKIGGFLVSEQTRIYTKGRSAGRCQSPALGLIVERQEDIEAFDSKTFYDLILHFKKNKVEFKAKYIGTDKKDVKSFDSLEECGKVAAECKKHPFKILSIAHKDSLENPKPAFSTALYLQEVCKKLNLSVDDATNCAQQLFNGVEIDGKHVALITYIRTDDTDMAPEFLPVLKKYVIDNFGKEYESAPKKAKKAENAQEGHEAIRCIDPSITPDEIRKYVLNPKLAKIYELIWKRTIAAGMKPAIYANTIYTIEAGEHRFVMTSRELKFDGYKAVYNYGNDEDTEDPGIVKESFSKGEELKDTELEGVEKQTQPPAQFDEPGFLKELEKRGIGRPSTFRTILDSVMDEKRGYTKIEKKKIVPTELGRKQWHFLKENFNDVVGIERTAKMEADLDDIEHGRRDEIEVLQEFYDTLMADIKKLNPNAGAEKVCPNCGKPMAVRKGKYGLFWGCTGYPDCKTMEAFKKKA